MLNFSDTPISTPTYTNGSHDYVRCPEPSFFRLLMNVSWFCFVMWVVLAFYSCVFFYLGRRYVVAEARVQTLEDLEHLIYLDEKNTAATEESQVGKKGNCAHKACFSRQFRKILKRQRDFRDCERSLRSFTLPFLTPYEKLRCRVLQIKYRDIVRETIREDELAFESMKEGCMASEKMDSWEAADKV